MTLNLEQIAMMLIVTVNAIDEEIKSIQDNYELVDSYSMIINSYVIDIKTESSEYNKMIELLSNHETFFREYSNGLVDKYNDLILDGRSFKTANRILKLDIKTRSVINDLRIKISRFLTKTKGDN